MISRNKCISAWSRTIRGSNHKDGTEYEVSNPAGGSCLIRWSLVWARILFRRKYIPRTTRLVTIVPKLFPSLGGVAVLAILAADYLL